MRSGLSVKSKLMLILLVIGLGAMVLTGYLSWSQSRAALTDAMLTHLSSVRTAKATQLRRHIDHLRDELATLAEDRMVISAMVHFNRGFRDLNQQPVAVAWDTAIETYYNEDYFPELSRILTGKPDFQSYRPKTQAARYLQYITSSRTPTRLANVQRWIARPMTVPTTVVIRIIMRHFAILSAVLATATCI